MPTHSGASTKTAVTVECSSDSRKYDGEPASLCACRMPPTTPPTTRNNSAVTMYIRPIRL